MARRKKLDSTLLRLDKHLLSILVTAWRYELLWLNKVKKTKTVFERSRFTLLNNNYFMLLNILDRKSFLLNRFKYPGIYSTIFNTRHLNNVLVSTKNNLNYNLVSVIFEPTKYSKVFLIEELSKFSNVIFLNGFIFNKLVDSKFFFSFLRFNLRYKYLKCVSILNLLNFFLFRQFVLILRYSMFIRLGLLYHIRKLSD